MAPPPLWPTSTTGPARPSTTATTASTWSRRPIPERSAPGDSLPGSVRAWTLWPAARSGPATSSHDGPSSQNPGISTMSIPRPYGRAPPAVGGSGPGQVLVVGGQVVEGLAAVALERRAVHDRQRRRLEVA